MAIHRKVLSVHEIEEIGRVVVEKLIEEGKADRSTHPFEEGLERLREEGWCDIYALPNHSGRRDETLIVFHLHHHYHRPMDIGLPADETLPPPREAKGVNGE